GKSNIVDAIRWVLGEQSAKALRGGKMQDVIFQGTETRKPLQFCEVSLLFSDCEGQLGTQFNEVEISRKVTRDEGSDYYINGKSARLKDIQNLFMDTGIGRVSYSFMVQGQIDQILSSNPGERRAIFEEAAGITKYKTQRREALNKLALVEQNLARATDRIEEIGRQIGSLKRQASKALRYKRLSFRLRHLDLALNAKNYAEQSKLLKEDEELLKKISSEIFELSQKLTIAEETLSQMRAERAQCISQLDYLRQNAAETRSQKEQAERNSEFAVVRKKDLTERLEQISTEINSLNEQLGALEGRAQGDIEVQQMQLNLVSADDEVFQRHSQELAEIEEMLRASENELSRARQEALMSESSVTRLRANCTTLEVDLKSYQVRHAAMSDSIFQVKEELLTLENREAELKLALENANERLGTAEADITEAQARSEELRTQYRNKQMEIQQMDRQLASKSARLSLLNDFQSRMEGFSEGVKSIMKGRMPECFDANNVKIASQNVEVADGWTSAFETMLGSALDAVVLEDSSKLSQTLTLLRERNLGNAAFQVSSNNFEESAIALPDGIFKGADIVKTDREDLKPFVKNMVSGCFFCEDITSFATFVANNPSFRFITAVSRDGSILDPRGIVYASSGEKRDTESSFILRNTEIKRLKEEIEVDNSALTTLNENAMEINAQLDSAEVEIENRKNVASEIKREIASINAQTSGAETAIAERKADLEKKSASVAEMENSRFEAQDKLNTAMQALEQAEKTIAQSREIAEQKEREIAELRESKDQKYAVVSEARLELASKRARLESLEKGLATIREQQAETRSLIERRTIESQSISDQITKFDAETLAEKERSDALAETLRQALETIEAGRAKLGECEQKIADYEESLTGDRETLMRANSQKNDCDVRLAKLRAKTDYISERILNEYETEISSVDWKMELWKSDEEFELRVKLDELEEGEVTPKQKRERGEPTEEDFAKMDETDFGKIDEEVRELRERINAMGAVNHAAIEEYAELRERYDFLKAQTDDLWTSKNALVADIDEINATSQKLFADTFEQIRKNFQFTFEKIFGGGTADLKLVETEDVLDSGIEIVARPPGTVLKSLSLLSGGQRTMSAVSLLFAIYMVKPSPFCVLDELDAPLDDANVGRYTDLLKEFIRYSQFLVITHNKRTMSAADTIFGVTMQERGVTRLISMKLKEAEKIVD
ncbi:MAG: chromosome segregation protein SMC, partial [Opitutales bacterium]|nr:chromosome segregation protein SMC [Opitutales bacterium]